jgi:hypothetical protein
MTLRCRIHKPLPFDKPCEQLEQELAQNGGEGTMVLTPESGGTIGSL